MGVHRPIDHAAEQEEDVAVHVFAEKKVRFHHVGGQKGHKDDRKAEKDGPSFFCEVHFPRIPGNEAAPGQEQGQTWKTHGRGSFKELVVRVGFCADAVAGLDKQLPGGFGAHSEDGDIWIREKAFNRIFPDLFTTCEESIAIIIEEFSCADVFLEYASSV